VRVDVVGAVLRVVFDNEDSRALPGAALADAFDQPP
jgi:hypothetical protein